jgi:drug/metabolite transporter (DMT)-like permease
MLSLYMYTHTISFKYVLHHHHQFYSLLQASTDPTMLFHWLHSCALFLHPWIPRTRRSCSTLSSPLIGGLPFFLLPSILVNATFLHGSVSLARYRCPSHLSLPVFITLIISLSSYSWYSSWLYLLRQLPFSLIGPYIFLSNIFSLFSSVFVNTQLSLP